MLKTLMNVRQQSGRRRGRGGQNRQGGGRGPESGNRIDNRARGNAPQLLEKYKGLARDAQQSGDRVLMEYYLQFADHYFRVVMESRARQDEQRAPRGEGQGGEGYDGGEDAQDAADDGEDDFGFKLPPRQERPRQEREDRGPREDRNFRDRDERPREDRPPRNWNGNGGGEQRQPQQPRFADEGEEQPRRRELPPRRERAPRAEDGGPASFDTSVLPPAIGAAETGDLPMGVEGEPIELPAPKKRGRPRKDAGATEA